MASIRFEDVHKIYPDGTPAVIGLDLEVDDGEFMVMVGPSGCGKSTALRMIAGLENISDGKLCIGDEVVNDLPPKERDIAMVFQSYALYPHMSVEQNMSFALKRAKYSDEVIKTKVQQAAETLGLTDHLHRKPKALSGGQRQRVAMGRAIVRSPQVFLMDEPLSNLDARLRVQMRTEIADLQNRLGVTTVYVTHDQVEAMTMADRVAVLKRGVLQQVETPQALYNRPDNLFVAGFIGSPSMNMAEATVRMNDGAVWIELDSGKTVMKVADAALEAYPGVVNRDGGQVVVGMRPEDFASVEEVGPHDVWRGRYVTLVELLGAEMLVHFDTNSAPIVSEDMREAIDDPEVFEDLKRRAAQGRQTFTARLAPTNPPAINSHIDIGFRTEKFHFFDPVSGRSLR